jgi:hypothetical protein
MMDTLLIGTFIIKKELMESHLFFYCSELKENIEIFNFMANSSFHELSFLQYSKSGKFDRIDFGCTVGNG